MGGARDRYPTKPNREHRPDRPAAARHVLYSARDGDQGLERQQVSFQQGLGHGPLDAHASRTLGRASYHYVRPFADYLAYKYAKLLERYTEAKDFLLQNNWEEDIGRDRHTDLLIRFAEACGTSRERVEDPDNITAQTRGLPSWCYAVAMREDPIVAVAGLVVGLESQVPSIYRKQTPMLRER